MGVVGVTGVTEVFSQMAYRVMSPVTVMVVPVSTAPFALVAQPLNRVPWGAVKPQAGSV